MANEGAEEEEDFPFAFFVDAFGAAPTKSASVPCFEFFFFRGWMARKARKEKAGVRGVGV